MLQEYHEILIPKAIEYSAGILDYFFRGQIDVLASSSDSTQGNIALDIQNTSGEDFRGGSFQLFYDDSGGNRTPLPISATDYDANEGLPDADTRTIEFTPPADNVTGYTLVFVGTIGVGGNGNALDDVDDGRAIAVARFAPPYLWWAMEENSGDRVDSVQGVHLLPIVSPDTPGVISAIPGKLGTAVELSCATTTPQEPFHEAEMYDPNCPIFGYNGVTICGWLKYSGDLDGETFFFVGTSFAELSKNTGTATAHISGKGNGASPVTLPGSDTWHFFVLELDPAGNIRLQFDNAGTVYTLPGLPGYPPPPTIQAQFDVYCFSEYDHDQNVGAAISVALDEIAQFPMVLSQAQKDYLYNSGTGRTLPITLPP